MRHQVDHQRSELAEQQGRQAGVAGAQIEAPKRIWAIANGSWVVFFSVLGLVNYWVLSHYGLDSWVSFKLIKVGVVFVFAIAQALWLSRHATARTEPPPGDA